MTTLPSTTWRMLAEMPTDRPLPKGLNAAWDSAIGTVHRITVRPERYLRQAHAILRLENQFSSLSDVKLSETVEAIRGRFYRGRDAADDRLHAFAAIREVSARKLNERPYAVQLAGGLALADGCVAEMATGEGKTLTATLPATITGWRGRGCHVITVNDYLAQRDAELMTPIYAYCGLSVGVVTGSMSAEQRRAAYQADITYCTNKEVCADFLRDQLALGTTRNLSNLLLNQIIEGPGEQDVASKVLLRGLHAAIVDEADSVLVDESVTPLIISGEAPNPEQVEGFQQAVVLANDLRNERDYSVDRRHREITLTPFGKDRLAQLTASLGGIWKGRRRTEELIVQTLTAQHLYLRDQHYVVKDGEIMIVDEFTGRLMPDRSWRDGLHQAVQVKEGVDVTPMQATCARLSFQRFFRLYHQLCGMTGTGTEARDELWQIFHLPVVEIPTHRPCQREIYPTQVYINRQAKWLAVVNEIRRVHESGQPVLVGTCSVHDSEQLSGMLTEAGLTHQVLNAVRHDEEAQIVAQAGGLGKITVSTNMAGRGTDIKLGQGVVEPGGLHVIATERHESRRVDRQLVGRSARQGDPGSAQAILSLEDDLLKRYTPRLSKFLRHHHKLAGGAIDSKTVNRVFDRAQRRAESHARIQRRLVLKADNWLDENLGFTGSA